MVFEVGSEMSGTREYTVMMKLRAAHLKDLRRATGNPSSCETIPSVINLSLSQRWRSPTESQIIMMVCSNNSLLADSESNAFCSESRANCRKRFLLGKSSSVITCSYILAFASAVMLSFVDVVVGSGSERLAVTAFCGHCG